MNEKIYYHHFKVSGGATFPLDMLRYDECHPHGPDDAARIGYEPHDHREAIRAGKPMLIELVHVGYRRFWLPTVERWRSFGWSVVEASEDGDA